MVFDFSRFGFEHMVAAVSKNIVFSLCFVVSMHARCCINLIIGRETLFFTMVSCLLKIRAQAGAAPCEGSEITCVFKRLISSAISYPTAPSKNLVFYDG